MEKNLTNSRIERQNILNNELALTEIQQQSNIRAVIFENQLCFTKNMIAEFYEVDLRTIERYASDFGEELQCNGYEILKGKRLKSFINLVADVPDINVGNISNRAPQLAIFNFKAFLNIGMLLSESERAKQLPYLFYADLQKNQIPNSVRRFQIVCCLFSSELVISYRHRVYRFLM